MHAVNAGASTKIRESPSARLLATRFIGGFLIMDVRAVTQRLSIFSGGIARRELAKVFSIVCRSKSTVNLQLVKPCVVLSECVNIGHEVRFEDHGMP